MKADLLNKWAQEWQDLAALMGEGRDQTDPDRGLCQPRYALYLQTRSPVQDSALSCPGWFTALSMRVTAVRLFPCTTQLARQAAVGRHQKHLIGWSRYWRGSAVDRHQFAEGLVCDTLGLPHRMHHGFNLFCAGRRSFG